MFKAELLQNLIQGDEKRGFCRRSAVEDQRNTIFERSITAPIVEVAMEPMRRKLVWIESPNFQGWACTECAWVFKPSGTLTGRSLDEMKESYEQHRDKEFKSHLCTHPFTRRITQ